MNIHIAIHVCLVVLSSLFTWQGKLSADEAAIRGVVASYVDAREKIDPKAVEDLFTEDADQLVSSGEWRRGRPALVQGTMASSRNNSGRRTVTVETVRMISSDVAIADGRYEIAPADGGEPRRMWSTFVMKRTAKGWRIAAIRNMLPAK
ncbi:MAG: SgcJ/EcaC family oxidoreductase [Blastocatellales bacterium]